MRIIIEPKVRSRPVDISFGRFFVVVYQTAHRIESKVTKNVIGGKTIGVCFYLKPKWLLSIGRYSC